MNSDPDVSAALTELRAVFVRRMWWGMRWIALVGAPVSVSRAFHTGWMPIYSWHIVLALVILVISFSLKLIPRGAQSGLLLLFPWLIGLPGLLVFGLAAPSIFWLALGSPIASSAISTRAGAWVGAAVTLALVCAACGFIGGLLKFPVDANVYMSSPAAWASLLIGTGAFVWLTFYLTAAHHSALVQLLRTTVQQKAQIERFSTTDQLTGLPLNRLAEARISSELLAANHKSERFVLMSIDLDDFKELNRSFGHQAGDLVLRETARRLLAIVGSGGVVTRISGDHFLVFVGGFREAYLAVHLAEQIVHCLSLPIPWHDQEISPRFNVGISSSSEHSRTLEDLQRLATEAMLVARASGSNRYVFAAHEQRMS